MADTKPATDRDALRISIAETLARTDGHTWGPGQSSLPSGVIERYHRLADAVLAVLPAPDQRAAVLLEAADVGENVANRIHASGDDHRAGGAYDVVDELRRLAGEAQQDAGICELPHLTIEEEDACEAQQGATDAAKNERDDARNIAVTLEQQNARALELLRRLNPERVELKRVIAVLCGDCEHHPDAPVIGGMCGGCTQYPDDTRRGEL